MEVDEASFPHDLLGLIVNISYADFVSFDLELSGIPSKIPGWKRSPGRATLEDRYAETKAGAERYQILQVGITCASFDYADNRYVLRPYNINISPLLDERLDIERDIGFQSGSASFLRDNGFDLGAPFTRGVQYLSRQEAVWAKQHAWDRLDKKHVVPDIQLKDTDIESLDFVSRARAEIARWNAARTHALEITKHTGLKKRPPVSTISGLEKRLVHQLVRAEFKDLTSIGAKNCIRIIEFDALREAENTARLKRRVEESIRRQTGFRLIFEALAACGKIELADLSHFAKDRTGTSIALDAQDFNCKFDRAMDRLGHKKPVLVGHNMFTDMVYFYRCFVGDLPDTVQGFCEAVHGLFPKIVDTKYLATFAEGDLNASPSLQEIAEKLQDQALPNIITHAAHTKYHGHEAYHEAGYDSLLTATIMLRLSAKLDSSWRQGILDDKQSENSESQQSAGSSSSYKTALEYQPGAFSVQDGVEKVEAPVSLPLVAEAATAKKSKKKGKKKPAMANPSDCRYQTKNPFENLRTSDPDSETDEIDGSEKTEESEGSKLGGIQADATSQEGWKVLNKKAPTKPPTSWRDEGYIRDSSDDVPIDAIQRKPMEIMPAFDSTFWKVYGNNLRVYGTQETKLRIAEWKL